MSGVGQTISSFTHAVTGDNSTTNTSNPQAQSGTEPPSGITGQGTADKPYDQGNQPEQAAGPGIEPPSGQQGKGTAGQPYDQGNQPENNELQPSKSASVNPATAGILKPKGSQVPTVETTQTTDESRGRDVQATPTTSSATPGDKIDMSKLKSHKSHMDRSMSPGQLDDGTHVQTSGDKGESYTPGTMNKLKGKFHIGKH